MSAARKLAAALGLVALAAALAAPAPAFADFGIKSVQAGAFNENGTIDLQAGSRPYEFRIGFEMNQDTGETPEGTLRELLIDLPPGMVGNPRALPPCSGADFEGVSPHCPGNTQVGVAEIHIAATPAVFVPIYNLTPPLGAPAMLGLSIASNNSFQEASLRSSDYGVRVSDITIPDKPIQSVNARIWGLPAASSHDSERSCIIAGSLVLGCPSEAAPAPFLSLPTACEAPLTWTVSVDSVAEPGVLHQASVQSRGEGGIPRGLEGCNKPQFEPTISSRPETAASDSPTGLHFNLDIPQSETVSKAQLPPQNDMQSLRVKGHEGRYELLFKGESTHAAGTANLTSGSEVISGLIAAKGSGRLVSGSTTVSELNTTLGKFTVGQPISGAGIPVGTHIVAVGEGTLTLSEPASASGASVALSSAGPAPFVVGEAISGTGIPAGTTITAAGEGTLTLSAPATATATAVPLSADLPFDAPAAIVQNALAALSGIGAGNVSVTGAEGAFLITFTGALAQAPQPLAEAIATGEGTTALVVPFRRGRPEEAGPVAAIATAHLKDTVVTLPQGLALNPSAAAGRIGCPLTGPEGVNLPGSGEPAQGEAARCPAASVVGTVEVRTPLFDHPLKGTVYLARQGENPFGSLIALYVSVEDPLTGIVVKIAGKVVPDEAGRLTATFEQNPQLPFEDFEFDFFGGPRAALTTPPTCGTYTTEATLTPWSAPEGAIAHRSDSFAISSAPGGGPCPGSEAQMPNSPSFEAGTVSPLAGAYSPFVVKMSREDGSQRFGALNTTLPAGVTANFNGVAECSESQIAQAASRNGLGQGALEQQSPSCPQASQIGTVTVGAGSGAPFYVNGKVYLSGPYKGAPFSLAIVTPAVAGPFDLGTVVVRAALYVNETTGQGTVKSDPLPTILKGVPLAVRSVAVKVDRAGYVLNPTSCAQKEVSGEEISTTGAIAPLHSRFQVGGCKGLDFSPKLSLSMKGATKRSGHPAFKATLTQPSGQANIARTVVTLPPTEFIDQNHISNPCTRAQFAEGKCPPGSVLGSARAFTPLLEKPLEGKVYFRSNGGERALPDVVVDLNGRIHFVLVGFVDAVHKKGSESSRVRTTFATVPDAPVSKFVLSLNGGKKGLLVNSTNICKASNTATVKMVAQNNKAQDRNQAIATSCSAKK